MIREGIIDVEVLYHINLANICKVLHKLPSEVENEDAFKLRMMGAALGAAVKGYRDKNKVGNIRKVKHAGRRS